MKHLILIAALLVGTLAHADAAKVDAKKPTKQQRMLAKIQATPVYLKHVAEYKKLGGSFKCDEVKEILITKDYATMREDKGDVSKFKMVVVMCKSDPNDELDPIPSVGLAVFNRHDEVISFETADFSHPD